MRLHRFLAPAVAVALLGGSGLVAGCGGRSAGSPAASPSVATDGQILAIGREYAQCLRTHGIANYPDPVVADGRLAWQVTDGADPKQMLQSNKAAADACHSILDRLPASAVKRRSFSPEDMQNLLRYAQCMRQHGIPDWPDPQADGTFELSPALRNEGKSSRRIAAGQACDQYLNGNGIAVSK
ncbi:hypothetical protein [Rugosimonospora africana]|uniref:Lipoprotein n=1 Tax=Rugosimonospora africana TaxID=556532 RepID=A0A8J3VNG8_9ACTN|nr:hypothetical protein [Rugosimonospora africana]GIH12356.1 hypothetical protein Raf01_05280 [Rugosimonospora africana]